MRRAEIDPARAIRNLNLIGFALLALLVGGIGGWAATSKLSGAVIGPGNVVVESNVKKVQHPTGGIVGEILVREGDTVETGQLVMRLDETVTRATLGIVRSQLDELTARRARLEAERDGLAAPRFPDDLLGRASEPTVALAIASEARLLEARLQGRDGQRAQLRERIVQIKEEVSGLSGQRDAKDRELALINDELAGVEQLFARSLIGVQRVMQLRRDQARLAGERNSLTAQMAGSKGKISEIELQILQLDQDFRTEVLKELRDVQGKIAELRERLTAAEDQLMRIDIRAPQSGVVHQLAVHTVGAVIAAGETIMLVVPLADELVVEARIAPGDIDQIASGASASVHIMAGNRRTTPDLHGTVTRISADLVREKQADQAFYVIRVTLPKPEVRRLGDLKLIPGMPAEVFVQTGERTPLQYLLKPLREQIARAFRER
ncbi:MAG: HlyD family type I secretion periplasmic adaptor subunit [Xanthobacteraceae bacterium]